MGLDLGSNVGLSLQVTNVLWRKPIFIFQCQRMPLKQTGAHAIRQGKGVARTEASCLFINRRLPVQYRN